MAHYSKQITLFVSILITLSVIYYAYFKINIFDLFSVFQNVNWPWLVCGFVAYIINYVVRAIRFILLLHDYHPRMGKMWAITSLYGMYNYLMPVKSGEFSFVAMAVSKLGVDVSRSTAVLVVTRLFDFAVIAVIIPFVMVAFWSDLPYSLIVTFVVYCLIVFLSLVYFIRWLKKFSLLDENRKAKKNNRFVELLDRLKTGMYVVEQRNLYIPLFISTALIWFLICLNFYSIVIALGVQISFLQAIVITIFMIPVTLLPIQGFANVGTHELGWAAAFALFDYANSTALTIAIGSHGVLLVSVIILGLAGTIIDALDW